MPLTTADILDAMSAPKVCGVGPCGKPVKAKGLCQTHYQRLREQGDIRKPASASRRERQRCTVPNCTTHAKARGLCDMHYSRWRSGGTPLEAPRKGWFRKDCQVPDCDRKHDHHGFCSMHWRRMQRWIAQQCD
jgi:hypothetical protein